MLTFLCNHSLNDDISFEKAARVNSNHKKKYQSSLPQIQLNFGTIHNGSWSEDIANKQTHLILFEEPKQRWKSDERFGKSSLKHS